MTEGVQDTHLEVNTGGEANENNSSDITDENNLSDHDKAMLEKADQGIDPNSKNVQGNKDDLLAGKYKTEADLHKGVTEVLKMQYPELSIEEIYKGLESGKLTPKSSAAEANGDADADEGNQSNDGEDGKDDGTKRLTDKLDPLDPTALTLEMEQNDGNLTQDTRDKLIKDHGISEQTIDTHLAGINAMKELFIGKVYDMTGGEENYGSMIAWMNANVPEAELDAYNEQLATQDINKVTAAVAGMDARFKAAAGADPNLLRPDGGDQKNGAVGGYASKAEWLADQAKPEYQTDPAFRAMVMEKLSKSTGF